MIVNNKAPRNSIIKGPSGTIIIRTGKTVSTYNTNSISQKLDMSGSRSLDYHSRIEKKNFCIVTIKNTMEYRLFLYKSMEYRLHSQSLILNINVDNEYTT